MENNTKTIADVISTKTVTCTVADIIDTEVDTNTDADIFSNETTTSIRFRNAVDGLCANCLDLHSSVAFLECLEQLEFGIITTEELRIMAVRLSDHDGVTYSKKIREYINEHSR